MEGKGDDVANFVPSITDQSQARELAKSSSQIR